MTPEDRAAALVHIQQGDRALPDGGEVKGRVHVWIEDCLSEDDGDGPAMVAFGVALREAIADAIRAAIAEEREQCARLVESNLPDHTLCIHEGATCFAAAIRARGEGG